MLLNVTEDNNTILKVEIIYNIKLRNWIRLESRRGDLLITTEPLNPWLLQWDTRPWVKGICWATRSVHSSVLAACPLITDMHWSSGLWAVWRASGLVSFLSDLTLGWRLTAKRTADISHYLQTSLNTQLSLWRTFRFKCVQKTDLYHFITATVNLTRCMHAWRL